MYLVVLNGEEDGKRITLDPGVYTFGRSGEVSVPLSYDKFVSGRHAELKVNQNGTLFLRDLGSTNGTYLLGEDVGNGVTVNQGDIFRIGHTFFKVTRRTAERFASPDEKLSDSPEAIVVVDIVGSSKIAQALGDRVASKIKNVLFKQLNSCLTQYPAEYLKNTGDGFMLVFNKPLNAVKCAVKLLQGTRNNGEYKGFHIRVGINYGETYILPDGDRRGMTVDMAFRIESVKIGDMHQTVIGIKKDDLPRVDRIFISEVLYNLIGTSSSITCRPVGYFDLKGFTGRHLIYEIVY